MGTAMLSSTISKHSKICARRSWRQSYERTLEGGHHWWGIWWAFCRPALELKSGRRDAYRSAKLLPFPTTTLSSRNGLSFGGTGRLTPSRRPKPAEKYSRLVGDRRGHRSGF